MSISSFPLHDSPDSTLESPQDDSPGPADAERERFELLFHRAPTPAELARFHRSHERLTLRLPARARRRAARIIASL
ncbi:hypothetical protein [Nocardioides ferulae]|uniref:hypothetical protein n=1 Tax=Nocardioides ferulae TaxID=2340821 RepID=UPI000EAFE560|nr:hypothetical protein [Nocardioides ferulae]